MTDFWDTRYEKGGNSGKGSVGLSRFWKWNKILMNNRNFLNESVIDFGCGDLSFWEKVKKFQNQHVAYIGIDKSKVIVEKNKEKFPLYTFYNDYHDCSIVGENVLFLDVMFHIMTEKELVECLQWINEHFSKKLFINTWHVEPNKKYDHVYQHYWSFDYLEKYIEYDTIVSYENPFVKWNTMYIFGRYA